MRILHISSGDFFSTYGGGQVYVKNVVDEMIHLRLDVGILSSVDNKKDIEKKDYNGIPIYEVAPDCTDETLIQIIQDFNPTIIHAHSRKAEVSAVARKLGIPVVVTAHHGGICCPAGTLMDIDNRICHKPINFKNCLHCELRNIRTGDKWYPFMKWFTEKSYIKLGAFLARQRFIPFITPVGSAAYYMYNHANKWNKICENADLVIAPCRAIEKSMILNRLDKQKVIIVPHGIPLPKDKPIFPSVENGKVKFFYVGRMSYIKGLHILLEAFHKIDSQAIELHLIGGTGNKNEMCYLSNLKNKYKKDNRIIWHGKVPSNDVYSITKDFHVACSPAIYLEVFGLNIAEALALGKPVLASHNGGADAQIIDGINGWLVPQNDVTAMKSKMEEIIRTPEKIAVMSRNCHAIDIKDHVTELLVQYKNLEYIKL